MLKTIPKKENVLVGDSDSEAKRKDEILARLASIATVPQEKKKKRKYRSKFFFEVSPNILTIEKIQKAHKPYTPPTPINKEVEERTKQYEKELSPELNKNLAEVREFFLKELAPKTFATDGGLNQVLEIMGNVVGEIEPNTLNQFQKLSLHAVNIRMCRFVAQYFGLSEKDTDALVNVLIGSNQTPSFIPIPINSEDQNRRKDKLLKDVLTKLENGSKKT